MKKLLFFLSTVLSFGVFASCSSDEIISQNDAYNSQLSGISTSITPKQFINNLDSISFVLRTTRSSELDEEEMSKLIDVFVKDGQFVQKQLLDDVSLSEEEADSIANWSYEQLAMLSIYTNAINLELASTTRANNKSLTCLSQALVGGGSVTGGLTWALVKRVGARTALRLATSALGGIVGSTITVAMYANDYYTCMNS